MWSIGVYVDFPQSGKWMEMLFRAEGEGAYSILPYLNGEAGRLSTMRIGAWVEVRGVGLCGGFRNRGTVQGLGKLLETVWEFGMRPLEMDALYRFADVPWSLPFTDLAGEVEGGMVEKGERRIAEEWVMGAGGLERAE